MTMPSARTIMIDGRDYSYVIKSHEKQVVKGWTPRSVRIVVDFGHGKYVASVFRSKRWTPAHDEGLEPAHKVPFEMSDVRAVVSALINNGQRLKPPFELPNWRLVAPEETPPEAA